MTGADPVTEKHPILLCEDSGYTLKQLSSIIQDNDYEDLGNHATKAMGEIGLFSLVQECLSVRFSSIPSNCCLILTFFFYSCKGVVMMKGFMDRCMFHETAITRLREKVEARDAELRELTA